MINDMKIESSLKIDNLANHAIDAGRRADFSFLLSLYAPNVKQFTLPKDELATETLSAFNAIPQNSEELRQHLNVPKAQALQTQESSYALDAMQSKHFHESGMTSARLMANLAPSALAHLPESTHGLDEQVFHNLSLYERKMLSETETLSITDELDITDNSLYGQLNTIRRLGQVEQQLSLSA